MQALEDLRFVLIASILGFFVFFYWLHMADQTNTDGNFFTFIQIKIHNINPFTAVMSLKNDH